MSLEKCFFFFLRGIATKMKESQYRYYSSYLWWVPAESEILRRDSHPSTIQAQCCLPSVLELELVYPTWQIHWLKVVFTQSRMGLKVVFTHGKSQ